MGFLDAQEKLAGKLIPNIFNNPQLVVYVCTAFPSQYPSNKSISSKKQHKQAMKQNAQQHQHKLHSI